jgi:hypothetical protein
MAKTEKCAAATSSAFRYRALDSGSLSGDLPNLTKALKSRKSSAMCLHHLRHGPGIAISDFARPWDGRDNAAGQRALPSWAALRD